MGGFQPGDGSATWSILIQVSVQGTGIWMLRPLQPPIWLTVKSSQNRQGCPCHIRDYAKMTIIRLACHGTGILSGIKKLKQMAYSHQTWLIRHPHLGLSSPQLGLYAIMN